MGFKLVMLPAQTDVSRAWGKRLAAELPQVNVVVAEGEQQAQHDIVDADAAFGTLPGVLITPHTAGHGPYLDERRYEILRDNCCAMLSGMPLRNVVDKASWF